MFSFKKFAAVTLALGATGTALASTVDYDVRMTVPEWRLPKLATGSSAWDGPDTLAGSWTTIGAPDTFVRTRDISGYTTDPVTNQSIAVYDDWRTTDGGRQRTGPLATMMEASDRIPKLEYQTYASAEVHWSFLTANAGVVDAGGEVESEATWSRDFSLDPLTSFTFTTQSTFSVTGDDTPLNILSGFNLAPAGSFASLTMGDVAGVLRSTIGAAITSVLPSDLSGVFGFSFGADGLMSLTVTNTTSAALTGTLSAGSYVHAGGLPPSVAPSVAAPVPEPEAILSMLAGLGLVGATVARRRRRAHGTSQAA